MAYYRSKLTRSRGGVRARPMIRVVADTLDEMRAVAKKWPDATTLSLPPSGRDCHRSKSIPMLFVDQGREDILQEIGAEIVSDYHVDVLTFMIRREWYAVRSGVGMPEDVERFFTVEIRGKLIQLLRYGAWIDDPETEILKNLNAKLEKIDLGRRSDLKFSSDQSETLYQATSRIKVEESQTPEAINEDLAEVSDNEREYRDGSAEDRHNILASKPWLSYLMSKYPS